MELTFHSTGELIEFLDTCVRIGKRAIAPAIAIGGDGETHDELPKLADDPQLQALVEIAQPMKGFPHDAPEPAKRKRRTKAEMEAARAEESGETVAASAAAGRLDGSVTTSAAPVESQSTAGAGNPFAQQTLPEGQESAGAPATAATQAPAEAKQDVPTTDIGDLQGFVAARLAERPTLENIEHLNMARNFIAKHGMPKYNETFALAGLSANIMAFSPADCARHAAVLDFLATE